MAVKAFDSRSDRYLFRFMQSQDISELARSTTVPSLRKGDIEGLHVPLAPLAEQKRIADKLDALLERVDACRNRLDRIPSILKRFRQSLLAAATSGKLTEDWRSGNSIEDTWSRKNLGDYVENCDGKRVPISEVLRAARHGEYPYYGASGIIDTIDGYTHEGKFLLIGEDGANLLTRSKPIAFIATGKIWVNNHAHVLQCRDGAPEEFLGYFINSIDLAQYVSGSAQPKLNQKNMNSIVVPVPPIAEQTEIVHRVEALFAYADRIEARYTAARAQVEKLTPATLAKAFRGELVPQDLKDEPASKLLERIKSARADGATKPKRVRTTDSAYVPKKMKENNNMTKSRQDDDVRGQPYLAAHLRKLGGSARVESLFEASELPVTDFYKQLVWEVSKNMVSDAGEKLELGDAA